MITCGESLCNLGKNEAKIWVVSDSVLSVDQKWDFEIIRFAKIQQITFKATLTVLHHWKLMEVKNDNLWWKLRPFG